MNSSWKSLIFFTLMFFKALLLWFELAFFYDNDLAYSCSSRFTLKRLKVGTLKGLLDPDDYYSLLGFAAEKICLSFG